ncbi:unnamed protein product [Dicrocoelium dendriticum]|nr:unnamed protein product [Dicrocoelium dendriticum]
MSDVKMSRTSDRYIFSRDYLTVKVWDMNMPSVPVEVHPVQTQLRDHLGVLYESELLCDDFKLTVSSDDRFVASGSYNRSVKVFDRHTHENSEYSLVMQKEELSPFVDPFSAPVDPGLFAFSLADSAELPWPRRIVEEKDTGALGSLGFDYSSECGKFGIDVGCKWLQVSWRPGSYVFAVSHADGIHLLEALC